MQPRTTKPSPTGDSGGTRATLILSARRAIRSAAKAVGRAEREFDAVVAFLDKADGELSVAAPGAAVDDAETALATLRPKRTKGPAK